MIRRPSLLSFPIRARLNSLLLLAMLMVGAQTLAQLHSIGHEHTPDQSDNHVPCQLCLLANHLTPDLPTLASLPLRVGTHVTQLDSFSARVVSRALIARHGHDPPQISA